MIKLTTDESVVWINAKHVIKVFPATEELQVAGYQTCICLSENQMAIVKEDLADVIELIAKIL